MRSHKTSLIFILICSLLIIGCGTKEIAAATIVPTGADGSPLDTEKVGSRDNTPHVLTPTSPGTSVVGNDSVQIDLSNVSDGYLSVIYKGSSNKVKLQITAPNDVTYTYDLNSKSEEHYFPLSCGDGRYGVGVYTNVTGKKYATAYATEIDVKLADPLTPFLYPNEQVWFSEDMDVVLVAAKQAVPANNDLEVISLMYSYIVSEFTYDWDKAENVESGYVSNVDDTLHSKTGICLDYAAVLTAMLRSQGIPTRMEIGYAGTTYHAWVSSYVDEIGWINGIIEFDGVDWQLMDPTLATTETKQNYEDFISKDANYRTIYLY